jgi:UbiA prenyltransferase family
VNVARLRAWTELLRVPAVLTVPGDALTGAAATGLRPTGRTALAVGASLCLYEAGMALNDWADRDEDAVARPHRPLPSGRIRPGAALAAAGGLTAAGLALAACADRRALAVAVPLAGTVWAYDLALKHTKAGPAAMAGARFLDLLMGAVATSGRVRPALAPATVLGAHTYAVTLVSRREAEGGSTAAPLAALAACGAVSAVIAGRDLLPAPAAAALGRTGSALGSAAAALGSAAAALGSAAAAPDPTGSALGRTGSALGSAAAAPDPTGSALGRTAAALGSAAAAPDPTGSALGSAAAALGSAAAALGSAAAAPDPTGSALGRTGSASARSAPAPGSAASVTDKEAVRGSLVRAAMASGYLATFARPLAHAALNPSPPLTQRAVGGGIRAMIALQGGLMARAGAPGTGTLTAALAPLAARLARKVSPT